MNHICTLNSPILFKSPCCSLRYNYSNGCTASAKTPPLLTTKDFWFLAMLCAWMPVSCVQMLSWYVEKSGTYNKVLWLKRPIQVLGQTSYDAVSTTSYTYKANMGQSFGTPRVSWAFKCSGAVKFGWIQGLFLWSMDRESQPKLFVCFRHWDEFQ